MTDRELLKLAAKAAGMNYHFASIQKHGGVIEHDHYADGKPWNPLTDDGDALRLAVKCCIQIGIDKQNANAMFSLDSIFWENCGDDPYAATRRAIVRAAAEIGKGMK
jgi:hypothetical protein